MNEIKRNVRNSPPTFGGRRISVGLPARALWVLVCLALILVGCREPPAATEQPAVVEAPPGPEPTEQTAPDEETPEAEPPVFAVENVQERLEVASPDGAILVSFLLMDGAPYYAISREGNDVILPSRLGFVFSHEAPLRQNFALAASETQSVDEVWTQPWGEVKEIRNHYNELHVALTETTNAPRILHLTFRAFDDGVGFRYEIPEQAHLTDFEILDEETEFILAGNHQSWWIPAYGDNRYEYLYTQSPISDLDIVHTPLTMATAEGLYLSIHEAALTDYSSMTLWHTGDATLLCDLVPWSDGVKVKATAPLKTPWRTIQIAETPGDLITSYLILNLNEPNRLADVSWIHPGKYVGIWWGMHLGLNTWGSGPDHGATTENALRYMDFAADNGFAGVLIEGWNVGWDGDWTRYGDRFEFTTPYDDFDIETVATYAAERGVTLIGHHETGAAVQNYEEQMEEAFAFYRDLGVTTVKTGYVGWGQGIKRYNESGNLVGLEWHHGQHMVEHYRKVVETAADYQIMLIVHEPIKDTGIRRTYPNMMSREGARGQEYNAWDGEGGNPPDHTTILPFTRMLAGPMDFTPGIFDLLLEDADRPGNRINTTLAKQLALYVVLYSPHQMAADLPENYAGHPALQFIRDVPTDWETTQVLNGAIGDYITIARKDRASSDWYLGSITDEEGRTFEIPLTFLDEGRTYTAQVYADAETADWDYNPLAVQISEATVDRESTVTLKLAPGGGVAIRFHPETALD